MLVKKTIKQGTLNNQKISINDIIIYLEKIMGTQSHLDWRNHIINSNDYFILKDVFVNSLKSDLSCLEKTKIEKYKQINFLNMPPIVIGSDGNIIDGYHRVSVAKELNIVILKAYVGIKK